MKQVLPLLVLLLFSTPVVAENYNTVLHTEKDEDFRLQGFMHDRLIEGEVSVLVRYNVTLINDNYNKTTLTTFRLHLLNESGSITSVSLPTPTINYQETAGGIASVTADVPPQSVTGIDFRGNHTALLKVGGETTRQVSSFLPLDITVPDQRLNSFTTNATVAHRGHPIYVEGATENVRSITIGGATLDMDLSGRFNGWVPVPTDVPPGQQDVLFALTTDIDQAFYRQLPLTIENLPPTVSFKAKDRRQSGQYLRVDVTASDEVGVTNITITHWNQTVFGLQDSFQLDTRGLAPGTYNYTVTATDTDNATTAVTENVTIFGKVVAEEDGSGVTQPTDVTEDPIGVITEFASFITGFFAFLLP